MPNIMLYANFRYPERGRRTFSTLFVELASPRNDLMYINIIVWDSDRITLTGIKMEENGLSDLFLEVFPKRTAEEVQDDD